MTPLTKFVLGLVLTTLIAPLGVLFLFSCIGGVVGAYKWYLNSWEQGSEVLAAIFDITFSWPAIKFYLLAWGVGIVMVCSLTYQKFKLEIHDWLRKLKR